MTKQQNTCTQRKKVLGEKKLIICILATLTITLSCGDSFFDNTPALTILPVNLSQGELKLSEDASTPVIFEAFLSIAPRDDVYLRFSSKHNYIDIEPSELIFTSSNYQEKQTFTIKAKENTFLNSYGYDILIVHPLESAGTAGYDGLDIEDIRVAFDDDEVFTWTVDDITSSIQEDRSAPLELEVDIPQHLLKPGTEYYLSFPNDQSRNIPYFYQLRYSLDNIMYQSITEDTQIPFTNTNNNQTIYILPVDNEIDEGTDANYDVQIKLGGQDVRNVGRVTVLNNDISNVAITSNTCTGTLAEGTHTHCTFDISLTSQPQSNVQVDFSVEGNPSIRNPNTITFTTTNWNNPQPITVDLPNDNIDQGSHSTIEITVDSRAQGDFSYNSIVHRLPTFIFTDDDQTSAIVSNNTCIGTLTEGSDTNCTFDIALSLEVTNNINISFDVTGDSRVSSPSSIVFLPNNWDNAQTVTLSISDDDISQMDSTIVVTANSTGTSNSPSFSFTLTDTDLPNIIFTSNACTGTLTEGSHASCTFNIALDVAPSSNTTVNFNITGDSRFSNPSDIIFTTTNWNNPQPITVVLPADNTKDELNSNVSLTASANGLSSSSLSFVFADDDSINIITSASGSIQEGNDYTFTIRLDAEPINQTQLLFALSTGNSRIMSYPERVSFDTTNWDMDQTMTITTSETLCVEEANQNIEFSINKLSGSSDIINTTHTFTLTSSGSGFGVGSSVNPYLISTANQFNNIRYCDSKSFELTQDIDLLTFIDTNNNGLIDLTTTRIDTDADGDTTDDPGSQEVSILDTSIDASWQPINYFTGTLDGKGYTIKNLAINTSLERVGLFGIVHNAATIQNVGVEITSIFSNASNQLPSIGGLAAVLQGQSTIQNSFVIIQGDISGFVTAHGHVQLSIGGLVGFIRQPSMMNNNYTVITGNLTGSAFSTASNGDSASSVGGLTGFIQVHNRNISSSNPGDLDGLDRYIYTNNYSMVTGNISSFSTSTNSLTYGAAGGLVGRVRLDQLEHHDFVTRPSLSNSYAVVIGNIVSHSNNINAHNQQSIASSGGLAGMLLDGHVAHNNYTIVEGNIISNNNISTPSNQAYTASGGVTGLYFGFFLFTITNNYTLMMGDIIANSIATIDNTASGGIIGLGLGSIDGTGYGYIDGDNIRNGSIIESFYTGSASEPDYGFNPVNAGIDESRSDTEDRISQMAIDEWDTNIWGALPSSSNNYLGALQFDYDNDSNTCIHQPTEIADSSPKQYEIIKTGDCP